MSFILGLDIGQQTDHCALAADDVLQRPNPVMRGQIDNYHAIRGLHRWPLRTPYIGRGGERGIVEDLADRLARPPLRDCVLAIDRTGVGDAIFDLFRAANLPAWIRPITITSGHEITEQPDSGFHVPKKELVTALEIVLQNGRLGIDPACSPELAEILKVEFGNFHRTVNKRGHESFGNTGDAQHDDVVLAVAMAVWLGERTITGWDGSIGMASGQRDGRNPVSLAPPGVFQEPIGGGNNRPGEEGATVLWE